MTEEKLKSLISAGLSTRDMAKIFGVCQATVRHYLKKYKLKTTQKSFAQVGKIAYKCCVCGSTDPSGFYGHKKQICGKCHNQYCIDSGRSKRRKAIEYLGGRCIVCGFDKYDCSLAFHHLDPSMKDANFSSMRGWGWERILKEIQGCVLLCHNCHAAYHAGFIDLKEYIEVWANLRKPSGLEPGHHGGSNPLTSTIGM